MKNELKEDITDSLAVASVTPLGVCLAYDEGMEVSLGRPLVAGFSLGVELASYVSLSSARLGRVKRILLIVEIFRVVIVSRLEDIKSQYFYGQI